MGLDKIFDLIEVPGSFLEAVKRHKLTTERHSQQEIVDSYSRCARFMDDLFISPTAKWQNLFAHIVDLEPSIYHRDCLAIHELFELKTYVYHYQLLRSHAIERGLNHYDLPDLSKLFQLLDPEQGKIPSFRLSPLYSSILRDLDKERGALSQLLKHKRQDYLALASRSLNLPNLKDEFILSRSQTELISKIADSGFFILSRESIANLIYVLADNPETHAIKADLAEIKRKIETEENAVLYELSKKVQAFAADISIAVKSVKELGWDFSLAAFARKYDCCIPSIADEIELIHARNLPLQLALENSKRIYQKQNLTFSTRANLITGPNMGGKTSILKCLAQFSELIKRAIPLPAEKVSMPLYDFVYYNHSDEGENLSSFGSEVVAFCDALKRPGRGLFLLDEFGKGTNPREGEALATAVIRYLANSNHTTVAATHFTAPAMLKEICQFQIKGIQSALDATTYEDIHQRLRYLANAMDYELISLNTQKTPPMDALKIAKILGLPQDILTLINLEDE